MNFSRSSLVFIIVLAIFAGCSRTEQPEQSAGGEAPGSERAAAPCVATDLIDVERLMPELPPVKPAEVKEQPADETVGDIESCETLADAYETALGDTEISEEQRAALIVSAAQKLTDPEELSAILQEIDGVSMRNSICVRTIVSIMKTGNETAKGLLQQVINDFTGTDEEDGLITTPEALWKWYNDPSGDNLDDEQED